MRTEVLWGFTGDGDEDWALACLYLSNEEIAEYRLEANNYNGKEYDWITLPSRNGSNCGIEPQKDEQLVASYGGMLSEICMYGKGYANSTTASAAYFCLPEFKDSRDEDDTFCLPEILKDTLYKAIEKECGNYHINEFNEAFYDGKNWVEGKKESE